MNTLKLSTSNPTKAKEFKRLGSPFLLIDGEDLKEIDSQDHQLIAAYKAQHSGLMTIVEDTVLILEGEVVHDIRYRVDDILKNNSQHIGKKASMIVCLSYMDKKSIKVFQGVVNGSIGTVYQPQKPGYKGFALDSFFYPDNSELSLMQLDENGEKDNYSPRKNALNLLLDHEFGNAKPTKVYTSPLPEWTGKWQA